MPETDTRPRVADAQQINQKNPATPAPAASTTNTAASEVERAVEDQRAGAESAPVATTQAASVYISPRVIDREAFNDYSGSLRKLIDESARQAVALRAAAAEAISAQGSLREATARQQAKFDAAARTLAGIDSRIAAAERHVQAAEQSRQQAERVQVAAERAGLAVEAAAEEARRALLTHAESLKAQLTAAIDGAAETVRRAEHGSTEAVMNLVGAAERKLAQVEARLIEFKPRAIAPLQTGDPATLDRLEKLLAALQSERVQAEQRAAQLRESAALADRSRQALTEAISGAERRLDVSTANAQAVSAQTQQVVVRLAKIVEAMGS